MKEKKKETDLPPAYLVTLTHAHFQTSSNSGVRKKDRNNESWISFTTKQVKKKSLLSLPSPCCNSFSSFSHKTSQKTGSTIFLLFSLLQRSSERQAEEAKKKEMWRKRKKGKKKKGVMQQPNNGVPWWQVVQIYRRRKKKKNKKQSE